MQPLQVLDGAALSQRLPFDALVAALRAAFAAADITVPLRHSHTIGDDNRVLLMPAWRTGGAFAVKTVTVFPGNGAAGLPAVHGLVTLFDGATGMPLAVLDGSELTARRTAAASALAADFLARSDATRLLVVGAGRVAALLPVAMRCVRPGLQRVTVWNRSPGAAETLAARWREDGIDACAATDLQTAVADADIVSCATLSTAPLVQGAWLQAGTHLDLIGSFTPAMRETDAACFDKSRVWVDTEEALHKSGDLLEAMAAGSFNADELQGTLATLCRGSVQGRPDTEAGARVVTVFKSVGTALEDLAAAELALGH
ncbi:MAG: ornithine cyclodeaminase family protein [Rubrivivax sp.]